MDWGRAKNILIAMFLIINIFLAYQLVTISRNQYKYIDQSELQRVLEHLSKKNVQMKTEIPDRVWVAPSIRVKYRMFDSEELVGQFFSQGDYELNGSTENFEISKDEVSVKVKDQIRLTYNNPNIKINLTKMDADKCLNNAYNFMSKLNLNYNYRYVKVKEVNPGYVRLVLGQQYNDIPVENSEIEILATEEGVLHAEILWFDWIKPDKKYNITTPVVALLKAYEERSYDARPVEEVKKIRQGYYFNTETTKPEEEPIIEGTISPMWVIESNKNVIYINGYNENIEKRQ